jgi:hypothetical protein
MITPLPGSDEQLLVDRTRHRILFRDHALA